MRPYLAPLLSFLVFANANDGHTAETAPATGQLACATVTVHHNAQNPKDVTAPGFAATAAFPYTPSPFIDNATRPFVSVEPVGTVIPEDAQIASVNCIEYLANGNGKSYPSNNPLVRAAINAKSFGCSIEYRPKQTSIDLYADARLCWISKSK